MSKLFPVLLSVFVLLIAALACVMPGVTTPDLNDPGFINTAIAQTHSVAASQTALMIPVTGPDTPTPTRAASMTPFPTFTPVVFSTPEARVSINTNCRTGPGNVYAVAGVLQVNEVAQVVGRSADGNFWAIQNPDRPGEVCWIPDQDTTISGFTNLLPVFTPPPTVTPTRTRIPVLATATRTRTSVPIPPARTATQTSPPPATPTSVPSLSPTGASRFTLTPTDSPTPSQTPTPSSTPTPTDSATPTDPSSLSPTPSLTATSTDAPTPTETATPSETPTDSLTSTPTDSATPTDPSSLSPTPSTSTPTDSPTPTDTSTPSQTPTASSTSTPTATSTPTPTVTGTLSQTPTPSTTSTPTPTVTGTLTPGFTAAYSGLESCPELGWWMDFQVSNTGTIPFETMTLTVTDPSTGTSRTLLSDNFTNRNGCGTATTLDTFDPGITHILSSAPFTYDPSGHLLTARIILCANPGPDGECVTQEVDFTP